MITPAERKYSQLHADGNAASGNTCSATLRPITSICVSRSLADDAHADFAAARFRSLLPRRHSPLPHLWDRLDRHGLSRALARRQADDARTTRAEDLVGEVVMRAEVAGQAQGEASRGDVLGRRWLGRLLLLLVVVAADARFVALAREGHRVRHDHVAVSSSSVRVRLVLVGRDHGRGGQARQRARGGLASSSGVVAMRRWRWRRRARSDRHRQRGLRRSFEQAGGGELEPVERRGLAAGAGVGGGELAHGCEGLREEVKKKR